MRIFAIGDLHLPGGQDKPMDIFGAGWTDHPARIAGAWSDMVGEQDLVLMPGDLSWAMTLDEARADLDYLGRLPGMVVMIKGNHDYWWHSISQVRAALPGNVRALQNDHLDLGQGWAVCGTRGWTIPGSRGFDPEKDEKIYRREVNRLDLSLTSAVKAGTEQILCMLHYPPTGENHGPSEITELLESHPVRWCIYGHLHGHDAHRGALQGSVRGVTYVLAACDAIGFRPLPITTWPDGEAG